MKTLNDLKRRLKPGTVFSCDHHARARISGPRTVIEQRGNSVCYSFDSDGPMIGWTQFPADDRLQFTGDDQVTFLDERGRPLFTYTVPE